MTTATQLRSPSSIGQALEKPKVSAAWRKRNGEANLLAGYLYEYATRDQRPATRDGKAAYQKQLILEAARLKGLKNWEGQAITSRRELTPEDYGKVITALRGMIEALGLPGPEHARDERAIETQEATTGQWKQIYALRQKAKDQLQWSEAHCENFERHQMKRSGGGRRIRTSRQANAAIRGYEGTLKHAATSEGF